MESLCASVLCDLLASIDVLDDPFDSGFGRSFRFLFLVHFHGGFFTFAWSGSLYLGHDYLIDHFISLTFLNGSDF